MIDDFPVTPTDVDYQIHRLIDSDLETCARQVEQHGRKSATPDALETTGERLFPELHGSPYRGEWLMPLVRRFHWNRGQGAAGAQWAAFLASMASKAIVAAREVREAEFVELAAEAQTLPRSGCHTYALKMRYFFADLAGRGPLSPALAGAAQQLVRASDGTGNFTIYGWALFGCENGFEGLDAGWALRVQRDVFARKKKDRKLWLRAFRLSSGSHSSRTAVDRIGKADLEEALRRWIGMLSEDGGTALTPMGAVLFVNALVLCGDLGGKACDELLYRVAQAPWKRLAVPNWLVTYLPILNGRPKDRAFACLEALMMNPATARPEVQRKYEAVLEAFGARALPPGPVGADGYPLDGDPTLAAQQQRIDQLLQLGLAAAAKEPGSHDPLLLETRAAWKAAMEEILAEFGGDLARLNRAVIARADWIQKHEAEYRAETVKIWREIFHGPEGTGGLMRRTAPKAEKVTLEVALEALRLGARSGLELTRLYVAENGWRPELVEAFTQWIPSIGSTRGDQVFRASAEWFVWFEDVCAIVPETCWSQRVKRDLRAMTRAEAGNWQALFENHTFAPSGRPPQKWMTQAKAAFAKMDGEIFRRRFVAWFEAFAKGEVLRITITGRNILRLLMWYALLAEDSVVDRALTSFAEAKWKTRESAERAVRAEMAFSYVMAQRAPLVALPILERQVASGHAFDGSETHKIYAALCQELGRPPVTAIAASVAQTKLR